MQLNSTVKGSICGIAAAVCYGLNPLGALNLYSEGLNTSSVLTYRFTIAVAILGLMTLVGRKSFIVSRRELLILTVLGVLFAVSSMSLYSSFHYMDAGIASTILFVYPVMVAVIMAVFFKERVTVSTCLSIVLALVGIGLLYKGDGGSSLSLTGVMLVMLSSLTYALYIIIVNKSSLRMSSVKLSFYVMLICAICIIGHSFFDGSSRLQPLTTAPMWGYAVLLGLVPTVFSLVLMTMAVHDIGSTPTAIMGALEPLTAVVIGVTVFGEAFTPRLALGILLILLAVILIILGKSLSVHRVTMVVNRLGHILKKTWRWK